MPKELIISANVHEKKVAILEDGVVTEYYVERRDEDQGLVGNLYKGRVMKVLPGMQSAFVDIGLERDAFLYVSDFTELMEDDDDDIDFREATEEKQVAAPQRREERQRDDRHKDDRQRRDDRRPKMPAPVQQPVREEMEVEIEEVALPIEDIEDAVEQLAEIAHESILIPPPEEEGQEMAAVTDAEVAEATVSSPEEVIYEKVVELEEEEEVEAKTEEVEAEAVAEVAPQEEPVVEQEKPKRSRSRKAKAVEEEPKKPASRSRKKADKPEEEPETGKRKGGRSSSKKSAAQAELEVQVPQSSFERITDEDLIVEAGELLKDAIVQEKIAERAHSAEYKIPSPPKVEAEPEPEWRVGSFRSKSSEPSAFERIVDETAPAAIEEASASSEVQSASEPDQVEMTAYPPFRHISDATGFIEQALADSYQPEDSGQTFDGDATEGDREASIRDTGNREEFALRRGGRGRRRGGRREGQDSRQTATATNGDENGEAEAASVEVVSSQKEEVERRPEPVRRPENPPSRKPDRRGPPSISELLHEGQEILVQIAKEPIAKKGARITSHIALPGRYLVYMPTVNHVGVSRKIPSDAERVRLKRIVSTLREREAAPGGFIARTACAGHSEQELHDDMRYLIRTWTDVKKKTERSKPPAMIHRDLDLVQRILRDQLSDDFTAIRVDNDVEYANIVEFVNRVQPKLVKRVKLYTGNQPIMEKHGVQPEIDKAVRPRVWLKSGGYIVINQTEALVAIDVNTGKFVGKSDRLEDTITRTNMEAAKEIVRQVRLRDLGGIIVIDFIDMEERKNRQKVMQTLQQELQTDRAPSKILSINDFGLVAITRKRVRQSLERTLCTPCPYCQGAAMVKSVETMCFEILEQAKAFSQHMTDGNEVMLRVSPQVAEGFRTAALKVFEEIEAYFGTAVMIEADPNLHQEQYDFALL
jgi:ribonuclease G